MVPGEAPSGPGSEDAGLLELSLLESVQEKQVPVGSLLCFGWEASSPLFHTVHGVLKARMQKWFATAFSSGSVNCGVGENS